MISKLDRILQQVRVTTDIAAARTLAREATQCFDRLDEHARRSARPLLSAIQYRVARLANTIQKYPQRPPVIEFTESRAFQGLTNKRPVNAPPSRSIRDDNKRSV